MHEISPRKVPVSPDPASAASPSSADPYQLRQDDIADPPKSTLAALRQIGPGMILAASIVGSGELIATTTLGAQVGYTALWVIVLSCLIKPAIQAEMGRYVIATGETGLEMFNRVPGPRWKVNWVVWTWVLMVSMTLLQVGAMFGGVAQVMNLLLPMIPVNVWVLGFAILTLVLLLGGGYDRIERLALVKVGFFTTLTLLAAVVLTRMPQYFSWRDIMEGFKFRLPGEGFATAVAVFGITGVGAAELVMYPYWCVEKGYARFSGKRDGTPGWLRRARGWIRVMHLDIIVSMVIYTVATLAFYLLGAGILHGMGQVPAANDMIPVLSNIYTQTLGGWSLWLFYAGAIATLYGTIFAATAANSRVFADMFRLMGYFKADDYARRVQCRRWMIVFLTVVPVVLYFCLKSPVKMVIAGGLAQSFMLPIIGAATIYLLTRRLPREIMPPLLMKVGVWLATAVIMFFTAYYIFLTLLRLID